MNRRQITMLTIIPRGPRILKIRTEKISLALTSLSKAIMAKEEGILPAAIDISTAILEIHNKFRERVKYIRGFGHK